MATSCTAILLSHQGWRRNYLYYTTVRCSFIWIDDIITYKLHITFLLWIIPYLSRTEADLFDGFGIYNSRIPGVSPAPQESSNIYGDAFFFNGMSIRYPIIASQEFFKKFAKEMRKNEDVYFVIRSRLAPRHHGVLFGVYSSNYYSQDSFRTPLRFELSYNGTNGGKCKPIYPVLNIRWLCLGSVIKIIRKPSWGHCLNY